MFSEGDAYERFMGRWSRRLAPSLVEFAGVGGADRVLDVGAATGSLSLAILQSAAASRVVGIDPSPGYVAYARQHVSRARASFEQGDAQRMPFADASFDRAVSLLVVNFIPDPPSAVREMIRVTRPGGVVAAAVWDYGEGMEMLRVFWDEAVALDPASESRDERHMPLCRFGELTTLWQEQDLRDIRETPLVIPLEFASFDDFWQPFLAGQGPAGAYVARLSADRRSALEGRLRERLVSTGDRPVTLNARAWAVRGVVPRR